MAKQGTSSVFKRLFLLLLGLVLVVYIVLAGFFVTFVVQQREVEMSGQTTRVMNNAAVIEQQIAAVSNVELQLFSDSRVAQLSQSLYADDYERAQLILDLLATIQNTQSINSIIDDIIIMFPSEEIELSAQGGYHKRQYTLDDFSSARSTASRQLVLSDGKLEMNISYPLRISLEKNYIPYYEIRIILSQQYLNNFIESFRNDGMEGAFWVLCDDKNQKILFSDDPVEESLQQHWFEGWKKDKYPGFFNEQITCEHGEFVFTSQYIKDYDIVLVTYQNSMAIAWKLGNSLWIISGIMVLMGVLFGFITIWANHSVNKPIRKIMEAFEQVRSGELDVRIFHKNNDEFSYIYDSFNETVIKIEELIENVKEQKVLLQNAELMQLQSQINPHFLYNSFYNIKFMAHNEEYEQIETFVTALAKYYRFINKETDLDVALSSEVAHMENYIEIQQMRFGDKITVIRDTLPLKVTGFKVPKLILQPIIENAYNYGLKDKLEGGLLYIRYRLEGKYLLIEIEDNGGNLKPEKLEQMRMQIHTYEGDAINHALTNIQRRLMLAYGEDCGLTLEIGDYNGLRATLKMNTLVLL